MFIRPIVAVRISYGLKIVPCGIYRRIKLGLLMDSFVTRDDVSRDSEALSELDQ
jgi:hypothetical protein